MADLAQNTALVLDRTGAGTDDGRSGIAINAGTPCYNGDGINGNTSYWPADTSSNRKSGGNSNIRIALNRADGPGQWLKLFKSGTICLGATLTPGETYVVSHNTGKIMPVGDLAVNNFVTVLGQAINTTDLQTPQQGQSVIQGTNTQHG